MIQKKKKKTQLKSNVHNMHFTCSIHCGAAALCTIRLNQFFSSNWYFLNIQLCVHRIYSNVRQIRCAKVRAHAHAPHTYQVSNFKRYFAKMIVHWIRFSNDEANKQQQDLNPTLTLTFRLQLYCCEENRLSAEDAQHITSYETFR